MKNSFLKMKMYWSGVFLGTSTVSSIRICPLEDMVSLSMTLSLPRLLGIADTSRF